jgi:hypothetical protein
LPPGHLHHLVRGTRGQDLRPRPHPQARMRAGRMRMGTCTSLSTAGENGPPCDGVADSRQTLRPARPRAVDTFLAAHPSGHLMTTGPDGVPDAALLAYFSAVATCRMKTGMELGGASLPTARRRTSTRGASPTKGLGNSSSDGPMPTSRRAGNPRSRRTAGSSRVGLLNRAPARQRAGPRRQGVAACLGHNAHRPSRVGTRPPLVRH